VHYSCRELNSLYTQNGINISQSCDSVKKTLIYHLPSTITTDMLQDMKEKPTMCRRLYDNLNSVYSSAVYINNSNYSYYLPTAGSDITILLIRVILTPPVPASSW